MNITPDEAKKPWALLHYKAKLKTEIDQQKKNMIFKLAETWASREQKRVIIKLMNKEN